MIELDDLILIQDTISKTSDLKEKEKVFEEHGIHSEVEFEELKEKFLENLIFNENIANMGENASEYFQKLIQLYGEKELADYGKTEPLYKDNDPYNMYSDYEEYEESYDEDEGKYEDDFYFRDGISSEKEENDYDIEEYEANDDSEIHVSYVHTLYDFVTGKEDELINVASTKHLKAALLASKLRTLNELDVGSIFETFIEYSEELSKYGKLDKMCYTDEYGLVDEKATLFDFANLPILNDKNFYMYLVKNNDETLISIDKLLEYLDPEIVNEQFINNLKKARETKKYEYQNDETNSKSEENINDELLAWHEGKEKTLASLEQEEKKISEAEALIEQQNKGQNIGDE